MFSYVMLGTNDLQRAIRFYDPLMELPGYQKAGRNEEGASWGTFSDNHTIRIVHRQVLLTSNQQALVMTRWLR